MIIKRLSASFGTLKSAELQLKPGLNIVHAPNEKGKSTWCGFIRAMLYGINTAERDKAGHLSEKTRYRPWSGTSMEGSMDIEWEGEAITIERTGLGASPMKRLNVRRTGTAEEVISLSNDSVGETLTGVPEKVFERSAFIRQSRLSVTQTGELEQRITALVSSGEENVSYTQADETLRAWQRKRKHNKTGQIPALEEEIAEIDRTLERLEVASGAYGEISLDLDRAMTRATELAEDLKIHQELEQRAERQKIMDAKNRVRELEWEITSLKKQLDRSGRPISKDVITLAKDSYDHLSTLTMNYTQAKGDREAAEKDLMLIEEEQLASGFEGCDIDQARALTAQAASENLSADKAADGFNQQRYTIPLAVLAVLALVTLVISTLAEVPLYVLSVILIAGAAVSGVLFYRKKTEVDAAEKKRAEIFARLHVGGMDDLNRELEQYERLCSKAQELKNRFEETDRICEQAMEEMQTHKDNFESSVKSFAPEVKDLAQAFQAMGELGKVVDRLETAERELATASRMFKTLSEKYDGDWSAPIPKDGLKPPLRNKTETGYDLKRMEKELDTLKNSYAMAMGEVRALGDPVVLGAKRNELRDRLDSLNLQYEALQLAVETLEEADSEIQARFSPILGKRAGAYIDRLTGGSYKRLLFDKNLKPSAERVGESVSRDILFLSGGTADQIYLALRLAICDLVFPQDKPCPIILDDALLSFDEERLGNALDLLKEISTRKQVILFTCHSREGDYFQKDKSVNLVEMK